MHLDLVRSIVGWAYGQSRVEVHLFSIDGGSPSTPLNPLITLTTIFLFAATGRCQRTDAGSSHTQNGAGTEVVIANSHRSTPPPGLVLPPRNRSPSPEDAQTAVPTPLVRGKSTLDKTRMVRFIEAPGEVDRANGPGSVARRVVNVSEAQVLRQMFTPTPTPSLGSFLLDIGSNTPRHSQAPTSRRCGTDEQEGSPRLEEGKFANFISITVLMPFAVRMVRSPKG